jgi:hypothetical protein
MKKMKTATILGTLLCFLMLTTVSALTPPPPGFYFDPDLQLPGPIEIPCNCRTLANLTVGACMTNDGCPGTKTCNPSTICVEGDCDACDESYDSCESACERQKTSCRNVCSTKSLIQRPICENQCDMSELTCIIGCQSDFDACECDGLWTSCQRLDPCCMIQCDIGRACDPETGDCVCVDADICGIEVLGDDEDDDAGDAGADDADDSDADDADDTDADDADDDADADDADDTDDAGDSGDADAPLPPRPPYVACMGDEDCPDDFVCDMSECLSCCPGADPGDPCIAACCGRCVPDSPVLGGDRDEHGCIPSAGYVWCEPLGECIRPWETDCPDDGSSAAPPGTPAAPSQDSGLDMNMVIILLIIIVLVVGALAAMKMMKGGKTQTAAQPAPPAPPAQVPAEAQPPQ